MNASCENTGEITLVTAEQAFKLVEMESVVQILTSVHQTLTTVIRCVQTQLKALYAHAEVATLDRSGDGMSCLGAWVAIDIKFCVLDYIIC